MIDSKGKSWTVTKGTKRTEIVLERWIIENTESLKSDQNQELPTIYKYVIILMRSLYTYTRLMPSWNLKNKLSSKPGNTLLSVGCRILNGSHVISSKGRIGLNRRIKDADSLEVNSFSFDVIPTPLGTLKVSVSYRSECDFFVKNSSVPTIPQNISTSQSDVNTGLNINTTFHLESENILNMEPSTAYTSKNDSKPTTIINKSSASSLTQGSLPSPSRSSIEGNSYMMSRHNVYKNHSKNYSADFTDNIQNFSGSYNTSGDQYLTRDRRLSSVSLRDGLVSSGGTGSTTIQPSISGTSPSANVSSPSVSSPIATKPSVSFVQPFKTPSLSASPSSNDIPFQSSSTPSSRPQSFSRTTSNSSLAALAALRNPNRTSSNASNTSVGSYIKNAANMHQTYLNENAISSSASSSRSGSVSRYSSSFGSRAGQWTRTGSISGNRPKPMFSGDPSSFGSSTSSVTEPGSGFLMNDDDDDLGTFLKTIDAISYARNNNSSVILPGSASNNSSLLMSQSRFDANLPGPSAATENSSIGEINLTVGDQSDDPLSRFRHLRESHTALSDSMHSSQISKSDGSPLGGSSGQNITPGSAGSGSASPSQAVFTFAMSPPSIQKTGSSHTPSIPSRLSEQYTPDDSYKVRYNIHPRKHGSRSGSLAIDEEMYIHGDHGSSISSSKDEQNISSSARTGALDIPRTHASRVQRRESLSFSNRHTSGYKDMQDALVVNNSNTHHQSLNTFGQALPDVDPSNFRTNITVPSSAFSSHRRYSTDVLGSEEHISSFNPSQSHGSSGDASFANSESRKLSPFISNSNSNNHSGNDDSNSSANAGNIHHQLESLPGNFRQQVSLTGGESLIHNHHLGQHHHHIVPSSSSVRSRRFSYYLPDDGEDDDDEEEVDDRERKTSPGTHAAESLPPMDEDVFFFALNDDEEPAKGSSSVGLGGSGTGGANTGSGTGSPSGGGRFNHSYDSLAWE